MWIDTHCHLTHDKLAGETADIVERAREAGVGLSITIGTGIEDGRAARELARSHPKSLRATVGLDPFTSHALGADYDDACRQLDELLAEGGYCALGEIGLDYHYDLGTAAMQRARFEMQLVIAAKRELPVVIHVREAHADMADVLAAHPEVRGVIHSFTGGPAEAESYLDLGWDLSFNGVATFKNAQEVRDAVRLTPLDRMVVETDSPYLAPIPFRGKRCEPAYVKHTAARLADELDLPVDELARRTTANAIRLFRLEGVTPD